jgi:VanZ family protein
MNLLKFPTPSNAIKMPPSFQASKPPGIHHLSPMCYHLSAKIIKSILFIVSISCLIFMFIGGPDYYSPRSFKAAWGLGHIFVFALWTFVFIRYWPLLTKQGFVKQVIWVLTAALVIGLSIEFLQSFLVERTADLHDVYRDLLGGALALVFLSPAGKSILKAKLRSLQAIVVVVVALEVLPFSIALADEIIAKNQFPVLADFETPFETKRTDRENSERCDEQAKKGKHSLQVQLTTETYSGTGLTYFPRDWSGYDHLNFSIYLPTEEGLKLTCRINDMQHVQHDQKYEDRFNRSFWMKKGWNDIKISLKDIADAPADRKMDLTQIQGLGIFAVQLPKSRTIYLDHVYLSNN